MDRLHAILGELEAKESAHVEVCGRIAYSAQSAFIVNDSVRNNILFGRPMQRGVYDSVLDACCLRPDLEVFGKGDQTEIGEQGITISGGQRQRISLARACYCCCVGDADILLLDDVLSAVDAHVALAIFENCLSGLLAERRTTVILVTHALHFLSRISSVAVMKEGKVVEHGEYAALVAQDGSELQRLMKVLGESGDSPQASPRSKASAEQAEGGEKKEEDEGEEADDDENELTGEEERKEGRVKLATYLAYIQAVGYCPFVFGMALMCGEPAAQLAVTWWLSWWSEDRFASPQLFYVVWYGGLSFGYILFVTCGKLWRARAQVLGAGRIHEQLLSSLSKAPISFFHKTPQGRVLNRFSSDMSSVDEQIHNSIGGFVKTTFNLLTAFLVMTLSSVWFLPCIVPLVFIYGKIQSYSSKGFREVKRIYSATKSPIYSHFTESLNGMATIRGYDDAARFQRKNMEQVDENLQASFVNMTLGFWLLVRAQSIGACVLGTVALLAVVVRGPPAFSALAIKYSLNISWLLEGFIRSATSVEVNCVSIERIQEYCHPQLEPEEPNTKELASPSSTWPSAGKIAFDRFTLRYRAGLEPALDGLSFVIEAGSRVGVCGRTGAGKR